MKNIVKIFSLALAMCMTLIPIAALAADNDSVSFEMRVL